jgi:hypothetical protein
MPAKKRKIIKNLNANQGFLITGQNNNLSESSVTNNKLTITEDTNLETINQGYQVVGDHNLLSKAKVEDNQLEQLITENIEEEPVTNLVGIVVEQLTSQSLPTLISSRLSTQINQLLAIKKMFLINRQETIEKLRECCDLLENNMLVGKYAKREERGNYLAVAGKVAGNWTFNLIEATGQASVAINNTRKRKFAIENSHNFQEFLSAEEDNLNSFNQTYNSLLSTLQDCDLNQEDVISEKEPSLFNNRHQIYEIATRIWPAKTHLDAADMKEAIGSLTENYQLLEAELQTEEQSVKKLIQLEDNEKTTDNQPNLITEISQLTNQLAELKEIAKEKLKSKNLFNKEKITQVREQLLQKYLINPTSLTESEQQSLEQKLSKELLNKLITTQQQLLAKQTELREQFQQTLATTEQIQSLM